jgi:hypothetical protein
MKTSIQSLKGQQPWNKGRLVGQKSPLRLRDIWAIRVRLQLRHAARDLALFDLAIDNRTPEASQVFGSASSGAWSGNAIRCPNRRELCRGSCARDRGHLAAICLAAPP